jgi:hypothetical protein
VTEKSEAMCKEMPVILFNRVVDPKRIIGKRRAREEERHKGPPTHKKVCAQSPSKNSPLGTRFVQMVECVSNLSAPRFYLGKAACQVTAVQGDQIGRKFAQRVIVYFG